MLPLSIVKVGRALKFDGSESLTSDRVPLIGTPGDSTRKCTVRQIQESP